MTVTPQKRKRGRPRKDAIDDGALSNGSVTPQKRKRGRPRKNSIDDDALSNSSVTPQKRKRGRPRKNTTDNIFLNGSMTMQTEPNFSDNTQSSTTELKSNEVIDPSVDIWECELDDYSALTEEEALKLNDSPAIVTEKQAPTIPEIDVTSSSKPNTNEKLHPQGDGVFGHGESASLLGQEVTNAGYPLPQEVGVPTSPTHDEAPLSAAFNEEQIQTTERKTSTTEKVSPDAQKTSTKLPTTIHLVDGEKGGCGKSFLSRTFIEYCTSIELDMTIVDADTSNKDIANIYPRVETAFFSDDEKQAKEADKIFDLALEKSVLVNLPAQVYSNVTNWILSNNLIELGKENSILFVKWFVCTGGVDSVNFFLKSLSDLGDKMTHVFVRNLGMCDDWSYIEQMPEFVAAKSKYNFTVIDLPKFPFWERNKVDRLGVNFESAIAHSELTVISKQRVRNFLKSAYVAFKETRLVR